MPTKKKTATRSKPDYSKVTHCTHEGCAAEVYGPLPKVWLRRGRDVLCPQDAQQAVWLRVTAADVDRNDDLGTPPQGTADGVEQFDLVAGVDLEPEHNVEVSTDPADANADLGLPPFERTGVRAEILREGFAEGKP